MVVVRKVLPAVVPAPVIKVLDEFPRWYLPSRPPVYRQQNGSKLANTAALQIALVSAIQWLQTDTQPAPAAPSRPPAPLLLSSFVAVE